MISKATLAWERRVRRAVKKGASGYSRENVPASIIEALKHDSSCCCLKVRPGVEHECTCGCMPPLVPKR